MKKKWMEAETFRQTQRMIKKSWDEQGARQIKVFS